MIKEKFKSKGTIATLAYVLSNVLIKSLGIITLPFYTNMLSEGEIGLSSLYTTWSSFLLVFATLGLVSAAYNTGYSEYKEDKYSYTFSLMVLSSIGTILCFIVYLLFSVFWNNLFSLNMTLMCIMFISFLVSPALDFFMFMQRYEYKYKSTVFVSVLQAVLSVVIGVLAVLYFKNKDSSINLGSVRIISTTCVSIVFCIPFVFYFIFKSKCKVKVKYWKYILPLSLPLIIHSVSKTMLDSSDKIMIEKIVGIDAVGIYSTLYNVSSLILVLWNAINASLVPYMFESFKHEGNSIKLDKIVIPLLLVFSVGSVFLTILAPELLMILTSKTYANAVYLVPPIIAGVFLTAVYNIFGNVLSYCKKTYFIMIGTLIASIVNICLNLWLIPIFGYVAAAYTTLVCFIILSLVEYIFMKIAFKNSPVNPILILIISISTVGLCLLCNLLYKNNYIRYAFLITILLLILIFSKRIYGVIKKMIGGKNNVTHNKED